MPEIRLSGVQKPCSLRTGNMGKKTRAARSQTREKPSCRKILTLCKVPERGAPKPLPKQRGRAGPGRPDARRNKGRRTSCGRRSARPRRRKRPRTCGTWCCRFRRCTQGRESAENRRRAAFFRGTATLPMPRGRKKKTRGRRGVATTPAFCPKEPARARMDAGRAHSPPPHLAARSSRKSAAARGRAACACAKKHRRGSAARPCACVRARKPNAPAPKGAATHGERLPRARGKRDKKVRPDPSSCNGIRPGAIREDDANADYLSTPTSL